MYELTLALFKPSLLASQYAVSEVLRTIKRSGLDVLQTKRLFWHPEDAAKFYIEHKDRFYFDRLVAHASSGPIMALLIGGDDALMRWRRLIGPAKAYKSMWEEPETLRARYAVSDTRNALHGSGDAKSARREIEVVFEGIDYDWLVAHHAEAAQR